MFATRKDPGNVRTITALAHLTAAQFAREQYDTALRRAIGVYGDRHTPVRSGDSGVCLTCFDRGMVPTRHEVLNHQTGSIIAGIYSDHFPDPIKDQLRVYARTIGEQTEIALSCWLKAGRRAATFREISQVYRTLANGRISFY